jgi:cyanophycinase
LLNRKGHLVIIGGGERPEYVMQKIVELAGGREARIVVIPNASSIPMKLHPDKLKNLKSLVQHLLIILFSIETADSDSNLQKLDGATGIFFSGGDQSNLTRDLLGTKLLEKIYEYI